MITEIQKITTGIYCRPSEAVVIRKLEDEVIIVPFAAGVGDNNDILYIMNATAQAIWERLDGKLSLREVATALSERFYAPLSDLERDIIEFVSELAKRGILEIHCHPEV